MTPEMKKFLQDLLKDAGQTDLGEALENQLIEDLYSRLETRLVLVAMEHLSEAEQEELENLTSSTPEATTEYLKSHIADYENVVAQALLDFRNLYIEGSKS